MKAEDKKMKVVDRYGHAHGLINSVSNSVKSEMLFHSMDALTKGRAEKVLEEKKKIVKARYLHKDGGLERLILPYNHGAGYPIETWEFRHDEVYDVWKGLVDQVNGSEGMAQRGEVIDPNTNMLIKKDRPSEKIHRFVAAGF